jgi:hypothetical protein
MQPGSAQDVVIPGVVCIRLSASVFETLSCSQQADARDMLPAHCATAGLVSMVQTIQRGQRWSEAQAAAQALGDATRLALNPEQGVHSAVLEQAGCLVLAFPRAHLSRDGVITLVMSSETLLFSLPVLAGKQCGAAPTTECGQALQMQAGAVGATAACAPAVQCGQGLYTQRTAASGTMSAGTAAMQHLSGNSTAAAAAGALPEMPAGVVVATVHGWSVHTQDCGGRGAQASPSSGCPRTLSAELDVTCCNGVRARMQMTWAPPQTAFLATLQPGHVVLWCGVNGSARRSDTGTLQSASGTAQLRWTSQTSELCPTPWDCSMQQHRGPRPGHSVAALNLTTAPALLHTAFLQPAEDPSQLARGAPSRLCA